MKVVSVFSLKASHNRHPPKALLGLLALCGCLAAFFPADGLSKVKPSRVPRPEPELKIVELNIAPTPYTLGNGPLQFSVTVQLPREVDGSAILEVTSLISSPSKNSIRFLTHRQRVPIPAAEMGGWNDRRCPLTLLGMGRIIVSNPPRWHLFI